MSIGIVCVALVLVKVCFLLLVVVGYRKEVRRLRAENSDLRKWIKDNKPRW